MRGAFAAGVGPVGPARPRGVHSVRSHTLLMLQNLSANSMNPSETARLRGPIWFRAGRGRALRVFSWCGSF